MKRILSLLVLVILLDVQSHAQYYTNQNKMWAFGRQAGLDFNSGSPVFFATSMNMGMGIPEGCASVCDLAGRLLFYTNGKKVYNKTGAIMPNGLSVVSFEPNSTEQAALIVPVIGNSTKYYLFSLGAYGVGKMVYCIVDMTLSGGLGDVVASTIETPVEDSLGENMIAIAGNSNNIWLVTHRLDVPEFLAYNITSAGIAPPVKSTAGMLTEKFCYVWGMLHASPDRKMIAQSIYKAALECFGTMLYDFDPATGVVSNHRVIDMLHSRMYGVEFSPDSKKLYTNGEKKVIQFDLSLPTLSDIQASKFVVTDSTEGLDLRLGPDGKIYFKGAWTNDLHCISKPDSSGAACSCKLHVVSFGTTGHNVFPNLYVTTDTIRKLNIAEVEGPGDVSLYPNPASNECIISYTGALYSNATIAIHDVTGKLINTYPLTSNTTVISTACLTAGIYLCRIDVGGAGIISRKLVVMR